MQSTELFDDCDYDCTKITLAANLNAAIPTEQKECFMSFLQEMK